MTHVCVQCVLEWAGSKWGDQDEYLLCEQCEFKCDWDDAAPHDCPACKEPLVVHVPHSEELGIRYAGWKYHQKWLPQRMYLYDGSDSYRYLRWLGREWRKRPAASLNVRFGLHRGSLRLRYYRRGTIIWNQSVLIVGPVWIQWG